jgi:hypothetical protein
MSYCRFSSNDFQCDVYCYASTYGGYITHVAAARHVFKQELPPALSEDASIVEMLARYKRMMELVNGAELVPIGGPYDGADFNDPTASAAADRLEQLRAAGYRVPQYAIDELREEAREEAQYEE